MAKLPRMPKSIPKRAPSKPPPFTPRPQPIAKPSQTAKSFRYRDLTPPDIPFSPTISEAEAKKRARVNKWGRGFPLIVMGLTAFGTGMYGVQLWMSLSSVDSISVPEDVSDRFDKEADGYDEKVNTAEWLLRLKSRRKALTALAHGHVLEVSVGTGRNIPYYPTKKCETVTLLDQSGPMLAVAKKKWKDMQQEYFHRVFFKQQSALDPITPPFGAQGGYDTVIQTMGLCSTPEPVKLLQNLETVTKEDGGQILLLEHGKSRYKWLNDLLDRTAPAHAREHGCWWNRDIGKIVEESGLEVVKIKRYNFGTTWWVELKPRKGARKRLAELKKAQEEVKCITQEQLSASPGSPVAQRPWWNIWR
ncbi:methyltransferase OMS1 mitochondrial precursor [Lojkania enalia]|uniref:Methyltransferase OMS1 mitochondrial n=1 Tax=Lojkania enalia TaxID=147567 RepID=A0A9P4N6W0_9PLEO|nr:methyltransferase OMS1 mitochondrial precursor [Didymosphaeria enalia]